MEREPITHSPCSGSSCAVGLGPAPRTRHCDLSYWVTAPLRFGPTPTTTPPTWRWSGRQAEPAPLCSSSQHHLVGDPAKCVFSSHFQDFTNFTVAMESMNLNNFHAKIIALTTSHKASFIIVYLPWALYLSCIQIFGPLLISDKLKTGIESPNKI